MNTNTQERLVELCQAIENFGKWSLDPANNPEPFNSLVDTAQELQAALLADETVVETGITHNEQE